MHGTEHIDQAIDIERALAGLTCKQREAVTLAMAGYTQGDIAQQLGICQSSVHHRLRSAAHCIIITSQRLIGSR